MPSRRSSRQWGAPQEAGPAVVDVLIPTAGRSAELAVTLAGLAAQDDPSFRVVVSDQSEDGSTAHPAVQAMARVLRVQGREVVFRRHLPRRGMAEHRNFLLEQALTDFVLFLDDDVWLEPGQLGRMHDALQTLRCGFVGSAVQGLSYLDDERADEHAGFEQWGDRVTPETVRRGTAAYDRWPLHNAANLTHIAGSTPIPERGWVAYKVAWIGGCVLFRRDDLVAAGGFSFWDRLPPEHSGEDVTAQWSVMARSGGAGILPSGAVHLEAPTTIPQRPVEAYDALPSASAP
jgi:GT2 family glycosyltransferase